jgi:hypothetical protein
MNTELTGLVSLPASHGRDYKRIENVSQKTWRVKVHLEDLSVDGMVLLNGKEWCEGRDYVHVAQNRNQWLHLVNTNKLLSSIKDM